MWEGLGQSPREMICGEGRVKTWKMSAAELAERERELSQATESSQKVRRDTDKADERRKQAGCQS